MAEVVDLILQYQQHAKQTLFAVTSLGKRDVILGYPWLRQHNPEINWQTQEVKLSRCPNRCAETSGRTHQEQKARPQPKDPQTPPQTPYYLDPNEDDPDDFEDNLEASGKESSEPGGLANEVEEGDCIFITMYIPPEAISATSTISQRIAEESAKDNPRQERSLHDMVPPCFWGHMDVFTKKSFDSLPEIPNATPGIMQLSSPATTSPLAESSTPYLPLDKLSWTNS